MKMISVSIRYILILALSTVFFNSNSQDCKLVRRTSKKSADVVDKGGSAVSKDLLLLYLEKHFDPKNLSDSLNYGGMTIIGSRYELKDSVTHSRGKFEFLLSNGETLVWDNATVANLGNALMTGYPNAIMFNVRVTEKQFEPLTRYYITKFSAFDIIKTEFDTKAQRQLMTIAGCLIREGID